MSRERITTEHSPESWEGQIKKHTRGEQVDIYARAGYPELLKREKELAEMVGTPDAALFNAGMAAIYTAIEAEELRPGDVVLCGKDVYSQTKEMQSSLQKRGVVIELCDSGDMEEIEKKVKEKKPRLIILEDVANSSKMQVCDLKKLSAITRQANERYKNKLSPEKLLDDYLSKREERLALSEGTKEKILEAIDEFKIGNNPIVFDNVVRLIKADAGVDSKEAIRQLSRLVKYVLRNSREKLSLIVDNTLASPALYNPIKDLEGAEAVVVESGTKHYQEGRDAITLGVGYSSREEKIAAIKKKRTELGTYLQPNDEKEMPVSITETMAGILKRHANNSLRLAELLNKSDKVSEVGHPNLPDHKQHELVKEIASEGLVTLFYLKVADAPAFVKRVEEIGGDKIGVGVSFGHEKTWLFNLGNEKVRIAAGSESKEEFEKVMEIFEKALGH